MAGPIKMPFGIKWAQGNIIRWRSRSLTRRGTFKGMTLGFSHLPRSTVPSGPDVGISPHAVNWHSDWPATEAVEFHISFSQ